jgi:nucleoside 2-deoxyribosyltransferase
MIYLIGSLRNPRIPQIGEQLRAAGHIVFDDWFAAGPDADDAWQRYEQSRGHDFRRALEGKAAKHVFAFDKKHLQQADAVVLALPAGKSGHLELGWALGQGKQGFVLLDGEPERYDVMYQFATAVVPTVEQLLIELRREQPKRYKTWQEFKREPRWADYLKE